MTRYPPLSLSSTSFFLLSFLFSIFFYFPLSGKQHQHWYNELLALPLLPLCCLFSFPLPSASLSPLLSPAPILLAACLSTRAD